MSYTTISGPMNDKGRSNEIESEGVGVGWEVEELGKCETGFPTWSQSVSSVLVFSWLYSTQKQAWPVCRMSPG